MKADRVRSARSADKKAIKRGDLNPASILRKPPDHWRTAHVLDLLLAIHYVGKHRAQRWLRIEGVLTGARIDSMAQPARERLARHVDVEIGRRERLLDQMAQDRA